jgi:hypothetical protein
MKKRDHQLERGQSLVEVALSMIFIFYFLIGLFDLGRAYFMYISLEDSAGEAALYLALNANCKEDPNPGAGGDFCDDPNNALYRAREAANYNLDWDNATIEVKVPTSADNTTEYLGVGETVEVTISIPFTLITPIISNIVGDDTLTLSASATQTIVNE